MYKISDYPQIQDNYYLGRRNTGVSKKLLGSIELLTIFLSRTSLDWPDSVKDQYYACLKKSAEILMSEAQRYGVSLKVKGCHLEMNVPLKASPKDGFDLIKDNFIDKTLERLQKRYKERRGIDSIPIILAFNEAGRCFSYSQNDKRTYDVQEISVVFYKGNEIPEFISRAIVHEVLHQFGAIDFYFPQEVESVAKKYIGSSIMGRGRSLTVDDLTAYLVGWKDTISANSYWFLKETMWVNEVREKAANKEEWSS